MTNITKHFDSLYDAEEYQNGLYDKYNHVLLVRAPLFSEAGTYVWEVK